MVSGQPAPADPGPASHTVAENAWPQRVLRNYGQLESVAAVPTRCDPALAEVVISPASAGSVSVASLSGVAAAVPAAAADRGALSVPSDSQSLMRRAVCGKAARTDLWEPRVGNRPG